MAVALALVLIARRYPRHKRRMSIRIEFDEFGDAQKPRHPPMKASDEGFWRYLTVR